MVPVSGSPPRVRGTVVPEVVCTVETGITPAGAGNRWMSGSRRSWKRDHPRGCGEQLVRIVYLLFILGSPPRVRGTVTGVALNWDSIGITPAGAGNSDRQLSQTPTIGDHPRGCGEQTMRRHKQLLRVGSPPRVRGTGSPSLVRYNVSGITPAGAGNRAPDRSTLIKKVDHPRGCGEQMGRGFLGLDDRGSPPRVRGTEFLYLPNEQLTGITPAGAGNSSLSSYGFLCCGDHPRGCGEQQNPVTGVR